MNKEEYIKLYEEVFEKTKDKEVSLAIMREIGLDSRTSFINEAKLEANKKQSKPSEKQVTFIKSLQKQGVIPETIELDKLTKEEATTLISETVNQDY